MLCIIPFRSGETEEDHQAKWALRPRRGKVNSRGRKDVDGIDHCGARHVRVDSRHQSWLSARSESQEVGNGRIRGCDPGETGNRTSRLQIRRRHPIRVSVKGAVKKWNGRSVLYLYRLYSVRRSSFTRRRANVVLVYNRDLQELRVADIPRGGNRDRHVLYT
jgi:hypothetical protein